MKRISVVIALVALFLPLASRAADKSSDLKFLVIRDYNGKPVRNASVVLHPVDEGKQDKGGFQLKTDMDGRTGFEGVPYGMIRIQVLAQGFQTFGQDYDINQPQMEITIKLKRPGGQFSVYEDKNQGAPTQDQSKDEQKKPEQK